MKEKVKILLIDDHKLVCSGIRTMLGSIESESEILITECSNGEEGLLKARRNKFDLVILDYQLPKLNGEEVARTLLNNDPGLKILVMSNYDDFAVIDRMVKTGVKGYVLKNIGPEELHNAIYGIVKGKNYFSNDVAIKLLTGGGNFVRRTKGAQGKLLTFKISSREREVLRLIANQLTNSEIAKELYISKRTVDTHRQNLKNKLNAKNTAGLVRFAMEMMTEKVN